MSDAPVPGKPSPPARIVADYLPICSVFSAPRVRHVNLDQCVLCGAAVVDTVAHSAWHRSLYPAFFPPGVQRARVLDEIAHGVGRGMTWGQAADAVLGRLARTEAAETAAGWDGGEPA